MVQAMRLQEKASQVGFDWENSDQVWEKVKEELGEVEEVQRSRDEGQGTRDERIEPQSRRHEAEGTKLEKLEEELGDLMFSVVNFARFNKIDADNALTLANKKFMNRFQQMEKVAEANGKQLSDLTLEQMDDLWKQVKAKASFH
jgi:XTP/dITP diphosphohydrolase